MNKVVKRTKDMRLGKKGERNKKPFTSSIKKPNHNNGENDNYTLDSDVIL